MSHIDARWKINSTLRAKGFVHIGPEPDRYSGYIAIGHTNVELDINILDLTFGKIPIIRVTNRNEIPLEIIAHLEEGTGLCYGMLGFLRLDPYKPGESILRILKEAEKTLQMSLAGGWKNEISSEYALYWQGYSFLVLPEIQPLPTKCKMTSTGGHSGTSLNLVENISGAKIQGRDAFIVNIEGLVGEHDNIVRPSNLRELKLWIQQPNIKSSISFNSVLRYLAEQKILIFNAHNACVGCSLEFSTTLKQLANRGTNTSKIKSLLLMNEQNHKLIRFVGHQASLEFITKRNMPSETSSFKGKKIAIVGCGTIGSHLARFLAQSGAGNDADLILVDNDQISAGNLSRHICGFSDIGKHKATSVGDELIRFHPDLRVVPLNSDICDCWDEIKDSNLIIDATGVENVSDYLNLKAIAMRKKEEPINLLHVWIVGNGIGTQTFLNLGDGAACYRCLRPELHSPWRFEMRKNPKISNTVVAPNCGDGAYMPYLVNAPVRAACIALTAAHDFISNKVGNKLRNETFIQSEARIVKDQSPKRSKKCPACRHTNGTH